MSPQQINAEIHRARGLCAHPEASIKWWYEEPAIQYHHERRCRDCGNEPVVPNYYESLDACAQMETAILESSNGGSSRAQDHEPFRYINNLVKVTNATLINHHGLTTYAHGAEMAVIRATAPQRCEAFLKVVGKWRDG